MKKNMKLNDWMKMEMMPDVEGAEQFFIGQTLTREQAKSIMRIIAQSMGFNVRDPKARKHLKIVGSPYRDFIVSYMLLMLAIDSPCSNWFNMLWDVLAPADQQACQKIAA